MWTFASERLLSAAAYAVLTGTALAAAVFYRMQNRHAAVGGAISWQKLAWLALAILLWILLPALIACDPRLSAAWRWPFLVLLALMLARGVIELWMLYVSRNWSPWYGIAHDIVCAAVLLGYAIALQPSGPLEQLMRLHLGVSGAMFGPEIYFAWYMLTHFHTKGDHAIYFVPDDPAYAVVLRVTAATVAFLATYLPLFLYCWLHGTP